MLGNRVRATFLGLTTVPKITAKIILSSLTVGWCSFFVAVVVLLPPLLPPPPLILLLLVLFLLFFLLLRHCNAAECGATRLLPAFGSRYRENCSVNKIGIQPRRVFHRL